MSSPHTAETRLDWTELASRQNDGLAISLLWSRAADRVKVLVADRQESFELHVENGEALDAFYHPYAYEASLRRRRADLASSESRQLQPQS